MKVPCILEVSESGRILRITHENGRVILEALIHGPLLRIVQNCAAKNPILPGRANIYRGELHGLAGYEYLNLETEQIEEKSFPALPDATASGKNQ